MPGLRGNLCWGNRGSFSIYGEYPSTGLDTPDLPYVSTNAYYGHHRLPNGGQTPQNGQEDMDTETSWEPTPAPITRKRLNDSAAPHVFKRIRQAHDKVNGTFIMSATQKVKNLDKVNKLAPMI